MPEPIERDAAARVAVIGGGWAGLAAAVRLSEAGITCAVFEAAKNLGGRARHVPWQTSDGRAIALDNGQHILIGAYRHTLGLLSRLGVNLDDAFERTPLQIVSTGGFEWRASAHRAPWHLVWGVLRARKLNLDERWAMVSFALRARRIDWALATDCSVDALLDAWEQPATLSRKLWEPLCIATLNTTSDIASAQVFLNVLRDSLGSEARNSDLLLPHVDLGSLLPDAAAAFLTCRARAVSEIRLGARIQNLMVEEHSVSIASGSATDLTGAERFDGAVLAVPPHEAARLLAPTALRDTRYRPLIASCETFEFQPIVTAYLQYREPPQWPARMLALEAAPHLDLFGQWAFNRSERLDDRDAHKPNAPRGLVAVVISADGPHRELEQAELLATIAKQLATQCGMPSQPLDSRLIFEKRATFACTPALLRPDIDTPHPHLVIAGDFVAEAEPTTHYPATLEAAVISGQRAAESLIAALSSSQRDRDAQMPPVTDPTAAHRAPRRSAKPR